MPEYKSIPTKVGDFTIETLDTKVPPQRILSLKEQKLAERKLIRMQKLHQKVVGWADQHMVPEAKASFITALNKGDYDAAYAVLQNSWGNIGIATFYQRDFQWPRWRDNFKQGFRP